ncbi:MAG: NAD-dependent epimerase/dehydratase family protein [Acetobacteraceae bacterium]
MVSQVHIIGASGRSGSALCRSLLAGGNTLVPVVRNAAKWAATGIEVPVRIADLTDQPRLRNALADATRIVSCAHARHAASVLAATPANAQFIFLGSTRKFTRWPDAHGNGVLAGEAAFLASGRSGVMLHPTMIYGAQGEDNVQRLAALLRRLPFVPLPDGGAALVQPIHQDDVTRAICAALQREWNGPHALVIAGPTPLPYADFIRAVAAASGQRPPRIVAVPAGPLMALARLFCYIPFLPRVRPAEIRRLMEDKSFAVDPMIGTLGFAPMSLDEGLARTFANRS